MKALILESKNCIIETLNLEDITLKEIDENAPLFGNGLDLGSIDVPELTVLLDKYYGIYLDGLEKGKRIFELVTSIAQYIAAHHTR